MAILVTGGAGYIGSNTAATLLKTGRRVVVLDNLSTGMLVQVPHGAVFIRGDVGDVSLVEKLLSEYEITAVLHFAAFIKVGESVAKPAMYYRNNSYNTKTLLDAVARCSAVKHFIFSSTAAVYGIPDTMLVGEDVPLIPTSPYGRSKLHAEGYVRDQLAGGTYAILRYFNVAGADPASRRGYAIEPNPTHLLRKAIAVAIGREEYLPVFGTDYPTPDGTGVRDYIHIADLVQAHIDALHYLESGQSSVTLNVGYGHGYSVLDIHQAVENVTGKKVQLRYVARREGDLAVVVADAARIRTALNWIPTNDNLEAIIRSMYSWEQLHLVSSE